jgi:simple sugar transport system ATP-binding protein
VALLGAGAARGRTAWDSVARRTGRILAEFDVRASGPDVRMDTLSGGNQQKFVLGRELGAADAALVVENPTRGLDILATTYVLAAIHRAAHQGRAAVVFHSSDVEEVLGIADRVFVCFGGQVREVPGGDHGAVARAMVGAA